MTEEQFKRVVEIDRRLNELKVAKEEINESNKRYLSYYFRGFEDYKVCENWAMGPIQELLDKHDKMIREEIDEEIRRLQEEIKEL